MSIADIHMQNISPVPLRSNLQKHTHTHLQEKPKHITMDTLRQSFTFNSGTGIERNLGTNKARGNFSGL